jgi:hypothetical protein
VGSAAAVRRSTNGTSVHHNRGCHSSGTPPLDQRGSFSLSTASTNCRVETLVCFSICSLAIATSAAEGLAPAHAAVLSLISILC